MRDTREEIVELYIRKCISSDIPIKNKMNYLYVLNDIRNNVDDYDFFKYPTDVGPGLFNFFWWDTAPQDEDYYSMLNSDSGFDEFYCIPNGVSNLIDKYREWRENLWK